MVDEIEKTFFSFWSNFGVKAYPQGYVPKDAVLPYITYNLGVGERFSEELFSGFIYVDKTKEGAKQRKHVLNAIDNVLQDSGVLLPIGDKQSVWLKKNTSYVTYGQDLDDDNIVYARISLIAEFFVK